MQAAAAGMVFQEVAGKRVWGTPTLAATGNPSDGEMGQLLTREIKSCGDGNIYMPIYSLMGRCFIMDRCGIAFFLFPQQSSFCWSARGGGGGVGRTVWLCEDSSPTPSSHRGKETRGSHAGTGQQTLCDPLVTSHGKGRQQNSAYCLDLTDRNPAEASSKMGREERVPAFQAELLY